MSVLVKWFSDVLLELVGFCLPTVRYLVMSWYINSETKCR
jgi:hypothetical protein